MKNSFVLPDLIAITNVIGNSKIKENMFDFFKKRTKNNNIKLDASWQELLNTTDTEVSESFLSDITELRIFLKSGNKIKTLHPILFMPNLRKLNIKRTFEKPVDFSYISQFQQIKSLNICMCDVTNVDDIQRLNHLEELNISNINIKTKLLSYLTEFDKLKKLNIAGTGLRSLINFQNNDSIETLVTSYSKGLKDISNLRHLYILPKDTIDIDNCPNIETIRISASRKPQTLECMFQLKKLKVLELFNHDAIIDLTGLHKLESLEKFFLNDTLDIRSIKSPCPNIKLLETTKSYRKSIEENQEWFNEYFPNAELIDYLPKQWVY